MVQCIAGIIVKSHTQLTQFEWFAGQDLKPCEMDWIDLVKVKLEPVP